MANLAAKYRPATFDDVTEQKVVVDIVRNICESKSLSNRNFLFTGSAGCGKAQPLHSKVLTPDGFIEMGAVQIGTTVYTGKGNLAKVIGVYPQGVRDIYKMTLQDGTSVEVSDEHLNVFYRYNDAKKVREDYCMTTLDMIKFRDESYYKLRVDIPEVDWPEQPLPIDPYLLGALLGDGSLSGNFGFSNSEQDVIAKVDYILRRDWNRTLKKVPGDNVDYNISPIVSDGSNKLKDALADLGLLCKSVDKHIPEMYLHNSRSARIQLLQGLFDTDGYTDKQGATDFNTSSSQLSDDFAFLVRSLGVRDFVSAHPGRYVDKSGVEHITHQAYSHFLKFPNGFPYCTSAKHAARQRNRQCNPMRNVVSIEYIGKAECQCIMLDHEDHTYISDGFIPTHNTTLGRIIANELNEHKGGIIELDAASHSGVDDMRQLIEQAKQYPVGTNYKVFIVDECVTGNTEILTDQGFKRIDSLDHTEKVAQFNKDDGTISFVKPYEYIQMDYQGPAYKMSFWNGEASVTMSPNHVQPYLQYVDGEPKVVESYVKDIQFDDNSELMLSGYRNTEIGETTLLPSQLLALYLNSKYLIADNAGIKFTACWPDEQEFLEAILADMSLSYRIKGNEITILTPLRSRFSELETHFDLATMTPEEANSIILWAVKIEHKLQGTFFASETKEYIYCSSDRNADFLSAVSVLGGYMSRVTTRFAFDGQSLTFKSLEVYPKPVSNSADIAQCARPTLKLDEHCGKLYCVKVPTQMIVLRANGAPFISGNCHALSPNAWQSALKTIEEQPAKSIFIWCTTNPEKIPETIISRVQTFQLSKISLNGIYNRLKYIIEKENASGAGITYEEDALLYIAKLAQGGMRDAITLLDKSLAYTKNISSQALNEALGLPNYDDYFALLNAIARKDNATIIELVGKTYNSGVNFVKWFEGFFGFITNIVKYIYTQDITTTMIPTTYKEKLSAYTIKHASFCLKLSNQLTKLNHELKTSQYLQELAIAYLCKPGGSQ